VFDGGLFSDFLEFVFVLVEFYELLLLENNCSIGIILA
jgi:hypothetical protein